MASVSACLSFKRQKKVGTSEKDTPILRSLKLTHFFPPAPMLRSERQCQGEAIVPNPHLATPTQNSLVNDPERKPFWWFPLREPRPTAGFLYITRFIPTFPIHTEHQQERALFDGTGRAGASGKNGTSTNASLGPRRDRWRGGRNRLNALQLRPTRQPSEP